ncbi:hypothetical protein RJ641_028471 [Dillenia turbinata]|uniref:Uncharacterized protein n=1 Tax=Dillenia turbinata TaxID=194707 RepID=A0AAN8ZJ22_9MAGN
MENIEEDVQSGTNRYAEVQAIGTAAQTMMEDKDYKEPPAAPLFEPTELSSWAFYRAGFVGFLHNSILYITVLTVMGVQKSPRMYY